ncbi:MAG: tetratricopeptide repeat protein [Candidatus Heimdallarchaeota archaeon]|nr:tetratricopeptide repeat protein [Candidatus Heimdallarchaeota archaeon]MDH5646189.1 tetratricopeptide repeat protein [Candidatus Heimdallarchaeota archaeon]
MNIDYLQYREYILNNSYKELYELTSSKLEDHTSLAYHLFAMHYKLFNRELDINTYYNNLIKHRANFEAKKESHPMEYAIYLARLGNTLPKRERVVLERIKLVEKALEIFNEKDGELWACVSTNLASYYQNLGEFDKSFKIRLESYEILHSTKYNESKALASGSLGSSYESFKQYDQALELYREAVELTRDNPGRYYYPYSLNKLCIGYINSGNLEEATISLDELKSYTDENQEYDILYLTAKAIYLKNSKRLSQKAEAEKILRQLNSDESSFFIELELCDLLLYELRITGEEEVLLEVEECIDILFEKTREANLYYEFARTYIQKSRLILIRGDFEGANQKLEEGKLFFQSLDLMRLVKVVEDEMNRLETEFRKHKDILQSNASFAEKLEKLELVEYMQQALNYQR